ncbi:MAG: dienelactone hydrolase [Frankiales bacterium]|nr:dienelactone hydrolase [Frankiales bacterium]
MCHSDASRPPAAPDAVPAASDGPLELAAADGTRVLAHEARPTAPSGVGIVVLPDVRGLHEYYRQLAVRFAETGAEAVAVDWFGRTAEGDDRSEDFAFTPHVQQMTPDGVAADVAAGVAQLRERGATRIFTVGFCLGGGYSWRQSADTPGLTGCIGFYGRVSLAEDAVEGMTAPLLMLVAGADAHLPVSDAEALARSAGARVPVELVVLDGAPHSFFDRSFAEHEDACARAWSQILRFVG